MASSFPAASIEATLAIPEGLCVLSYSLDVNEVIKSVQDDAAGAIAVFIAVKGPPATRSKACNYARETSSCTLADNSLGKVVTRLEYQAYSKLAIKTMANIIREASQSISRSEHQPRSEGQAVPSLIRCAIHHRLGDVPVGEPSIVIAVSSPHRKESFVACEKILEEVKLKAQIWKREFYEGEDESEAEWKENR